MAETSGASRVSFRVGRANRWGYIVVAGVRKIVEVERTDENVGASEVRGGYILSVLNQRDVGDVQDSALKEAVEPSGVEGRSRRWFADARAIYGVKSVKQEGA